jgi:hypothetical protein
MSHVNVRNEYGFGINEDFHLLGYNAVQSVEDQPKFQKNISIPSSGSKNMFLRNVVWLSTDYMALYPRG